MDNYDRKCTEIRGTMPRVSLINMPFGPISSPSIALALLQASLATIKTEVKVHYFNILFASLIGAELYTKVSSGHPANHDMIGEWLFTDELYGREDTSTQFIYDIVLGNDKNHSKDLISKKRVDRGFVDNLLKAKLQIKKFIDLCLEQIVQYRPTIIGFTSVFQQQLSSLLLAKRVKELLPSVVIVFGGANNEGVMGRQVLESFPWVDYVISGEGEHLIVELVKSVACGAEFPSYSSSSKLQVMDELPFVNYSGYFEQLVQYSLDGKIASRVPFETSRGCWWGAKNHCTFCGLNGLTMTQRSKSPQRALQEFTTILQMYPNVPISVTDNILDYKYFDDFIKSLASVRRRHKYELFYEVKANLTKTQLIMLKDAGITMIQPGIESFCTSSLKAMKKGVRPIQNIQLLKWSREIGIKVVWNVLCGFAEDSPREHVEASKMLGMLSHYDPPNGAANIRLDRFSPNYVDPEKHGFKNVRAYPSYKYIYPFDAQAIENMAYYFTYDYLNEVVDVGYKRSINVAVNKWRRASKTSFMIYYCDNLQHVVIDGRRSKIRVFLLDELSSDIHAACDEAKKVEHLYVLLNKYERRLIEKKIQKMIRYRLLLHYDSHILSLAISGTLKSDLFIDVKRIGEAITSEGQVKKYTLI